jgi:predicted kinase
MARKQIFLLIGQKGSGKSFIGTMLEQEFGIPFIRVEDWVKQIRGEREIDNEAYLKQVFEVIENGVRERLHSTDKLVFESTGLTDYFDQMLKRLRKDFQVATIGIYADSNLCLHRVRTRDQTIHINLSDDQVLMINNKVRERDFQTDFRIDNETKDRKALIKELEHIIALTPIKKNKNQNT